MVQEVLNNSIFFLAVLFFFTIPGIFICQNILKKVSIPLFITLSTVVGFTAFTLISYVLLNLKLPFLLFPIFIIVDFLSFIILTDLKEKAQFKFSKDLILIGIVFIIGIAGQLLIISPSGRYVNGSLVFYSSHGHDGPWHLSLMEEIQKGFPLQNPVFAGEKLVNYHFFSDISPALFNQYFNIPTLDLYFRMFPFLFSLLLGSLSFYLGKILGGSQKSGLWALIFTYFSGSFGYIITILRNKSIGGESMFWASQIQSSSGNPPLIASLVIILALIISLKIYIYKLKSNLSLFIIALLLLGTLAGFKSYSSLVALASIGMVGIWQLLKERKAHIFLLTIFGAVISLIIYLPNSAGATGFLIFEPWWFIRTMIVAPDRLNWIDLELRRQTYMAEGNWKRVLQIETTGFLIFLFGNLGMKFIGFLEIVKIFLKSLNDNFKLTLFLICLISLILPLLFLQKGVAGNTIQFLQYFLLLTGIFAGVTFANILKIIPSNIIRASLGIVVIILMVPTQAGLIYSFYNRPPLSKISNEELDGLKFLKDNSSQEDVIVTPPFSKDTTTRERVLPVWAWSDSSYVSAFSGRRTYLSDTEQADIMGYKITNRLKVQKEIFANSDTEALEKVLKQHQINYLYFPKILKPAADLSKTNLTEVFSNSLVEIWKVR